MLQKMNTRQIEGEPRRQWIADDYFDLYVWYEGGGDILGFQLCYDKSRTERALTWMRTGTFRHQRINGGESSAFDLSTPVLMEDCSFEREPLRSEFTARAQKLEPEIRDLVLSKLEVYPTSQKA
jgi:hypothetical protein